MTRTYTLAQENKSYAFSGFTASSARQFDLWLPIQSIVDGWKRSAGGVPVIINVKHSTYDTSTREGGNIDTNTDWRHVVLRSGLAYAEVSLTVGESVGWRRRGVRDYEAKDSKVPEVELGRFLQFLKAFYAQFDLHPYCHILYGSGSGMDICIARALSSDTLVRDRYTQSSEIYNFPANPYAVIGRGGNIHWTNFGPSVSGKKFFDASGVRAATLADVAEGDQDTYQIDKIVRKEYLNGDLEAPFISAWYNVSPGLEDIDKWKTGRPSSKGDATELVLDSSLGGLQLKAVLGDSFQLLGDDWNLFTSDDAKLMQDDAVQTASVEAYQLRQIIRNVLKDLPRKQTWWQINNVDTNDYEMLVPPSSVPRDIIIQNVQITAGGTCAFLPDWEPSNTIRFTAPIFAAIVGGGKDYPTILPNWTDALYVNSVHASNLAKVIAYESFH